MGYKDDYKDLRNVFLKFKRESYFETFNSANIFYILGSKRDKAILTFIDQFFGDALGLQCFFTNDGINYVHDILSTTDEFSVTVGDCDSIVAVFKNKNSLTDMDNEFLKKMGQRKTQENNLIIYRFKKGFKHMIASNKEIEKISLYAIFLDSLIQNEFNDIIEAFNQDDCVVVSLNHEAREYSCLYRPLPYLEVMPKKLGVNLPFVEDYKNHVYINDECYLFTSYLPVSVKGSGVRPLLLYFYFANSNQMEVKYVLSKPKDYEAIIYGILDEVFTKIGLPAKMVINNRDLYTIVSKTLDALSIENSFERDNLKAGEEVSGLISSMYQKTSDTEMEEEEIIQMFEFLFQIFDNIDDIDYQVEDTLSGSEGFIS